MPIQVPQQVLVKHQCFGTTIDILSLVPYNVEELRIYSSYNVTPSLTEKFKSLRKLVLVDSCLHPNAYYKDTAIKELVFIHHSYSEQNDAVNLKNVRIEGLESLTLDNVTKTSFDFATDFGEFVCNHTTLVNLKIIGDFNNLFRQNGLYLSNIRTLTIFDAYISTDNVGVLNELPNLQHLGIAPLRKPKTVYEGEILIFLDMLKLVSFSLTMRPHRIVHHYKSEEFWSMSQTLRHLTLKKYSFPTFRLGEVAAHYPNLESLYLQSDNICEIDGIGYFPKLESLDWSVVPLKTKSIAAQAAIDFTQNDLFNVKAPNLKRLRYYFSDQRRVKYLAVEFPKLEHLIFSPPNTEKHVKKIVRLMNAFPMLKKLEIFIDKFSTSDFVDLRSHYLQRTGKTIQTCKLRFRSIYLSLIFYFSDSQTYNGGNSDIPTTTIHVKKNNMMVIIRARQSTDDFLPRRHTNCNK